MDVIFLSSTKGKICTLGFCKPMHYIGAIVLLLSIIGAPGYVGYSMASAPNYQAKINDWKKEISDQKQELQYIQQEADANVDVLSSKLGLVQARVMRLDALGRRIMEISGMKGEFDFDSMPALGGPVQDDMNSVESFQLTKSIEQLSKQLEDKEKQLQILEDLLIHDIAISDTYPSGRPISKGWLSSYYGMRVHPISGKREMHKGIDFAGKLGSPVVALAKGIVVFSGKKHGYGQVIDIEHGNGYTTRYAHNSKLLVKVGDQVQKGAQIAEMGTSGRSTGPHVHLEVLRNNRAINPIKFVRASR